MFKKFVKARWPEKVSTVKYSFLPSSVKDDDLKKAGPGGSAYCRNMMRYRSHILLIF
jgi:hypothetical protein